MEKNKGRGRGRGNVGNLFPFPPPPPTFIFFALASTFDFRERKRFLPSLAESQTSLPQKVPSLALGSKELRLYSQAKPNAELRVSVVRFVMCPCIGSVKWVH